MGYGNCEKGYRIYVIQSKKIVLSRSVVFDEDKFFTWGEQQQEAVTSQPWLKGLEMDVNASEGEQQIERTQFVDEEVHSPVVLTGNGSECSSLQSTPTSTLVKLRSLEEIYARCHMSIVEPENYKEAAGI